MKSWIWTFMVIFMTFTLVLGLSWYVEYDHTQNTIEMAAKRALMSTMVAYVDEWDFEIYDVLQHFEKDFKALALKDLKYQIALTGFIKEPLFMQVEILAVNDTKLKGLTIHVQEAMIEELKE